METETVRTLRREIAYDKDFMFYLIRAAHYDAGLDAHVQKAVEHAKANAVTRLKETT